MDYNIYIHDSTGGSTTKRTKAWLGGNMSKTSQVSNGDAIKFASNVISKISNPDSLVNEGVSAVAKAIPWVAIAFAVVSAAARITDEITDITTMTTGDYSGKRDWNNFKTVMTMPLQPFSTALGVFKSYKQVEVTNLKREQQRLLTGESITNLSAGSY